MEGRGNKSGSVDDIDIEPMTGAPFFHINLTKTHVSPRYLLVIPAEGARILPDNVEVPVTLTRGTETWKMKYVSTLKVHKRLDSGWKQFAIDNKLKVGDVCTFQLLSKDPMRIKVQVLRGDFPSALLNTEQKDDEEEEKEEEEDNGTSYNPIVVE